MTTEITIDLDDYLSHDEKVQLARDAFKAAAMRRSDQDFERILSNAAYELVGKEVDAVFDGGMANLVKEKAVSVIKSLSDFSVFRKPDAWHNEASKGWVHLQEAMDAAAPLIHSRVQQIVSEMDEDKLRDLIESEIVSAIVNKLTSKEAA
jgi:hypothetical protein